MCPPTIRISVLIALAALCGCGGQLNAARQAYDHGNYLQAERIAAERLREHPDDAEAQQVRQQAREKSLAKLLEDVQAARARGDGPGAIGALGQLLQLRRAWAVKLPGAGESALAAELERAGEDVRGEVAPLLARGRALAAEGRLERHRALLAEPELAFESTELHAEVRQVGGRTCADLVRGAGEEPYWTHLVGRYCAHFGAAAPAVRLPGLFGGLAFAGSIQGLPAAEQAELQQGLNAAFARTPWYDGAGPTAGGRLAGYHQVTYSTRESSRTHRWSVQVPYQDTEYYYESRQVPYSASETYYESVPHTEYESYTYTCGYGSNYRTCTGSRPVTHYRQESRTRYVTKYRTESDRKSRSVTKYRTEPRSQIYAVTEHVAVYATNLSFAVNLGTGAPATARAEAATKLVQETSDYREAELDKTTRLPALAEWLGPRAAALEGSLVWELRRAWYDSACGEAAPSREQAARCLRGSADLPAPVRDALTAQLQEDGPRLLELARAPAK